MCKLIVLTNTKRVKRIPELVTTANKLLAKYERHGFGYAIEGIDGVFGEKIIEPKNYKFNWGVPLLKNNFSTSTQDRFGKYSKSKGAAIFHGRTSTNHINLINTHPLQKHGWTLAHNGVVTDHGPAYRQITTNDTEHCLERLALGGISAIEQYLTGYYAIAALDPENNLHIIKDNIANLYVAELPKIDSLIFATTPDLITDLCEEMNWQCSNVEKVLDNQYLVFKGPKLIKHTSILPKGNTARESEYSMASLGRKIDYTSEAITKDSNEDIKEYINEIRNYADSSYTFKDYYGAPLDYNDVIKQTDDNLIYLTVIRPDGTICSPTDYFTDKLYTG